MVKDHHINLIELVISEQFVGDRFIIPKGDGILSYIVMRSSR